MRRAGCRAPSESIGMCTPGAISTVGTAATAATKAACIRSITATPTKRALPRARRRLEVPGMDSVVTMNARQSALPVGALVRTAIIYDCPYEYE